MPPEALFVPDPREVPFLHDQLKKMLGLAESASRNVTVEEYDDFWLYGDSVPVQADASR